MEERMSAAVCAHSTRCRNLLVDSCIKIAELIAPDGVHAKPLSGLNCIVLTITDIISFHSLPASLRGYSMTPIVHF